MRRRAELVEQTRLRITEAAVRLHTTIGPGEVSMSAVAEEAGVTRLTLYRHFPTADALFAACMGHWRSLHPPPDPDPWHQVAGFEERARRALAELYRWYSENGDDLYPVYRDGAFIPASTLKARAVTNARMVDALVDGIELPVEARRRVRAAAGHVVSFWCWRSLVVDQALTVSEAVELAVRFVLAARVEGGLTSSVAGSGT